MTALSKSRSCFLLYFLVCILLKWFFSLPQFQAIPEGSHSFPGCGCWSWEGCCDTPHALTHPLLTRPLWLVPSNRCHPAPPPANAPSQTVVKRQVQGNLLCFPSHQANQPSHQTLGHPKGKNSSVYVSTCCWITSNFSPFCVKEGSIFSLRHSAITSHQTSDDFRVTDLNK